MDNRTKVAVLIVAILMIANVIYMQRTQPQRRLQAPARPDTTAAPQVPPPSSGGSIAASEDAAAAPAQAAIPFPVASPTENDLIIDTPLQRIRIARAGGVIRELALHRFDVAGDGPVNLVPPQFATELGRSGLGLLLRAPGVAWDLSRARFDPVGEVPSEVRLVSGGGPFTLQLRCPGDGGGAVVKRFTFDPDRYDFQVELELERGGPVQNIDGYTLQWSTGMPVTEMNSKDDLNSFRISALAGRDLVRKSLREFKRSDTRSVVGSIHWAALQSKYFMVALIPVPARDGTAELFGLADRKWMGLSLTNPAAWRGGSETYRIYAGPIAYDQVRDLGVGLEAAVELGWSWIRPLSWVLLRVMHGLHKFISNYGIVIILLSALAKLVFWPLTEKSFRSMRSMQDLQPRMEELKRRYKSDPQELNRQVMALYKERKVNPLGGCMPLIIQTPIFFALYSVLRSSVELRNAPFVGWITNLAAPDVLFRFRTSVPFFGDHFSLLPLFMGAAMLWQSKIGSAATPATGPAAQQQFIMKWMMPIMMTVMFYQMPSGLVLYWTVNTLMSIVQQLQINRKLGPAPLVGAAVAEVPGRSSHGAPDRVDGAERGRGSAARSGGAGGKTR